jgi:hypothetical protein
MIDAVNLVDRAVKDCRRDVRASMVDAVNLVGSAV